MYHIQERPARRLVALFGVLTGLSFVVAVLMGTVIAVGNPNKGEWVALLVVASLSFCVCAILTLLFVKPAYPEEFGSRRPLAR